MNRILLITDKKRVSTDVAIALHKKGIIGKDTQIDMAHTWGSSWWHYPIPAKISRSSIPFSDISLLSHREMELKSYIADNLNKVAHFDRSISGGLSRQSEFDRTVNINIMDIFANRWPTYDQIIVCPDPSPNGWGSAMHFLRMVGLSTRNLSLPFYDFLKSPVRPLIIATGATSEANIISAYREEADINASEINEMTNYYDNRQAFDYFWNYNSASLFSECLKLSGVDHPKIMTKYMLMALHILNKYQTILEIRQNQISTLEFRSALLGWKGTGKYRIKNQHAVHNDASEIFYNPLKQPGCEDNQMESVHQQGVASPMTIVPVIENLKELGLIDIKNDLIEVSDKGQFFLSFCHKNTFDPDLPFRLDAWCRSGDIDRMLTYLKTVFGRQKRFMNKAKFISE